MDDFFIVIYLFLLLVVLVSVFVLPLTALIIAIRSARKLNQRISKLEASHDLRPGGLADPTSLIEQVQNLQARIHRLEAKLSEEVAIAPEVFESQTEVKVSPEVLTPLPVTEAPQQAVTPPAFRAIDLESMIGRRWVGWAAVLLILFATAFFLKYAFDNRWIGEVGRVTIGIAAGVLMATLGYKYFRRQWRIFSQILTGGGAVLLYLSTYAAFGYYHLTPQKAAFIFLAILVAETAVIALLYEAPAIAIMALIGGFLTPLLLHSDRDQYVALFGYIIALDVGALALLKHWRGLRTIAFLGSHLLFWIWYDQNYHQGKIGAALVFEAALFLIFLGAHLAARVLRKIESTNIEDIWLLLVNPFTFFATSYHLLNPLYHDWMGVFAIVMALIYAGATKLLIERSAASRTESLTFIIVALTFLTIAIPIQLRSNWITIAWSVEALAMLWAGIETKTLRLRVAALTLFGLAIIRLLLWDTPYGYRPPFTPIFNRYFLSSLTVIGCLFAAAALYQTLGRTRKISEVGLKLGLLFAAVMALWLVSSIETHTYFQSKAIAQRIAEDARHQRWLGQMALSVVWAVYAAVLAALGFVRRSAATRWASLGLFAITIIKAMFVDIAELQQLYRIIVFFVLGVLLLLVAWGYHKVFQTRETST